MTVVPFQPLPPDLADVRYQRGPDSVRRPEVPVGETVEIAWDDSAVFPGTSRRFWIHVPAAYDPTEPAGVLVFLDGEYLLDPEEGLAAAHVLDNLVDAGEIPMTIGVFVDPGVRPDSHPDEPRATRQRNLEYDGFDDRLAEFLLTEIVPEVAARYALTDDPDRWGVCGFSSGGSGAFTVAWHRPDRFRRVLVALSSFAQLRGGNPYPGLIAATDSLPLRIFLQASQRDLGWNEPDGNWLAENLRVVAALAEAGYDHRLVLGDAEHGPEHLGVLLPDALRWLFRP